MNLTPTTELEAVNEMLRGIGESPLNTLDNPGVVDAVLAQQTLQSVSRNVQMRGWHWNTAKKVRPPLTVGDQEILLPINALKVDSVDPDDRTDVIQRGSRLYNRDTNSYRFERPLTLDIVEFLPFEELPQAARTFITLQANRKYQQERIGSDTLSSFHREDEATAWSSLMAAETETQDANIFDSWDVARVMYR